MGHSLTSCNAAPAAKSKIAARGPQNGSKQLLLNKIFDPSTPSMRKGCDGEEEVEKKIRTVKIVVH